jgi:mono/diheme cytochrome c family protein
MRTSLTFLILAAALTGSGTWVAAQQKSDDTHASPSGSPTNSSSASPQASEGKQAAAPSAPPARSSAEDRIEGEKRFRANCARCHQSPHKFSPRAMATIIRHMRVRATITDEDARLILKYMSQ